MTATRRRGEVGIDLYRTDDYVKAERISLLPLLRGVFERALGLPLDRARFTLTFRRVADFRQVRGEPTVVNLRGGHGYVDVRITRDGDVLYQHPHAVREIVGRPLQRLLADRYPDEKHWGFGIAGAGLDGVELVRPVPHVGGAADLSGVAGQPRRFHLEEVSEPEPAEAALADWALPAPVDHADAGVRTILAPSVHKGLTGAMPLSTEVEEGGFLLGRVFRDRDRPGSHLVRVDEALPAERTGASMFRFTFTGESFLRVNDVVAHRGPDVRLVGWYHTHLFAPTAALGLSGVDVDLHVGTFRRPWHVAGLVNLHRGARHLRVYGWDGVRMNRLPVWEEGEWTR